MNEPLRFSKINSNSNINNNQYSSETKQSGLQRLFKHKVSISSQTVFGIKKENKKEKKHLEDLKKMRKEEKKIVMY